MGKSSERRTKKRPQKRRLPLKHRKTNRTQAAEVSPKDFIRTVCRRSFYDLSTNERRLVRRSQKQFGVKITGWSAIPNPEVLSNLFKGEDRLNRYILVIETLRAKICSAVENFLKMRAVNANYYYASGSADFICDICITESGYKKFYNDLLQVYTKANITGINEDVAAKNNVSVYLVKTPLILCSINLSKFGALETSTIQTIQQDTAKFDLICQDCRFDEERRRRFNNERKFLEYIKYLEQSKAIVGFHASVNECQYLDREYVPLGNAGRALSQFLASPKNGKNVLNPVVELLEVDVLQDCNAQEVKEITHIFINEYVTIGERHQWKQSVYKELGDEVNIFTYPLVGTLNETSLTLSDLPKDIKDADHYPGEMQLGHLYHSSGSKISNIIGLPKESLANHGVTIGFTGTGKTTTDCVLIEEALNHLERVFVIDSSESHGIRDKQRDFPESFIKRIGYVIILDGDSSDEILNKIQACEAACCVIEASRKQLPDVFEAFLGQIERSDTTKGNDSRVIKNLLLVEEANDVFGVGDRRKQIVSRLESVLNKAYRWGWCIWLSTQRFIHLGHDRNSASNIFQLLQNKIIHQCDAENVSLIQENMKEDNPERLQEKLGGVTALELGVAFIRGTSRVNVKTTFLPPVITKIRLPGKNQNQFQSKEQSHN